ncbi:MAG: tandem-95 repeat protein, partial [Verrucomicrobia bacterium]|nr:tandem-95 repeat protein [Verrucomicrobiota bacterium]
KGNGLILYIPNPGFKYGEDQFTYNIKDARGAESTGSVWVSKAPSIAASGTEDTDLSITLTGPDAITSSVFTRVVELPKVGTLYQTSDGVNSGTQITSVPTNVNNPNGIVIFRPVADRNGNNYADLKFDVSHQGQSGAVGMVSISIAPVPDAPRAVDDRFVVTAGQSTMKTPLTNDSDADGDALTISSVTSFPSGTVSINTQGGLLITTDPLAGGTVENLTYVIADKTGLTSTATITLVIKGPSPNAWPTFGGDPDHRGYSPTTLGTTALSEQWGVSIGGNGSPIAVANGRAFVTLPVYFADTAMIGLDTATGAEIWRQIYPGASSINPPSCYGGDAFIQVQDGPSQTSHLVSFNEATGSIRWSSTFNQQWEHYLAPAVDETGVYINCGYYGGIGSYDTITGVPQFFVGLDQYDGWTPTLHKGRLLSFVKGIFRTHHLNTGATLRSKDYSWNWAGYTMNRTVACMDDVAYFINDPSVGGHTLHALDLATLSARWTYSNSSITGTPAIGQNSVFVLAGTNVLELNLSNGSLLRTYVTGGTNTLLVQPIVTAESLVVASSSNTYLFTLGNTSPRQTLASGGNVSVAAHSLFITGNDGKAHRFGVFDISTNPSPVTSAGTTSTNEDTPVTVTLTATDTQPLRFVVDSLPTQGSLYQTADGVTKGAAISRVPALLADAAGRLIYEPSLNAFGPGIGNFTFRAHDGNSPSVSATMTLNVIGVNDTPVAINDRIALRVGEVVTGFKPQFNDRDADQDVLTIISFTQPLGGTVTAASNGGINFAPDLGFTSGTTSFDYTIRDSSNASSTATVSISITGVNRTDWPTFGAGPEHAGFVPVLLGTAPFSEVWANTPGTSLSQVAVANGRVFLTLPTRFADTAIIALDAAVGGELWRKTYTSAASINPPTWHNGEVIMQVQDGPSQASHVVSLAESDGSQRWASLFSQQWEHYMAPAVDDTGVYVAGGSYGGIYGYSRNGVQKFFLSTEQYDGWTPTLYDGGLYSFQHGNFRSHNLSSGTVQWTKAFGWDWRGYTMNRTVACNNGFACLINDSDSLSYPKPRDLICIDLNTQAVAWTVRNTSFSGTPAIAHNSVFALSSANTVGCYDLNSGVLLTTYTASAATSLAGQPLVTVDTVIVSDSAKTYCFDLQTGALRQTLPAGGPVSLAGQSLFIASSNGTLHCFQAP